MTTQPQSVAELLEHTRREQAALTAERVALAERRAAYELRAQFAPLPPEGAQMAAEADDEARHRMGAIAWVLVGVLACMLLSVWATWLWAVGPVG